MNNNGNQPMPWGIQEVLHQVPALKELVAELAND